LAVAATWFVLGTVYLDRFPPVLSRLELSLMPWKQHLPAEANLDQRLDLMQQQLDASTRFSSYAFTGMIVPLTATGSPNTSCNNPV
jgi:hypothetical protein